MVGFLQCVRSFTRSLLSRRLLCFWLWLSLVAGGCIPLGVSLTPTSHPSQPQQSTIVPSATATPGVVLSTDGPTISQIHASSQVFAKSDCIPVAITITATVASPFTVTQVLLWHRVGADQPFTAVPATAAAHDTYTATIKGLDVPGGEYGVWEFYLSAGDAQGRHTQSPVDTTVQLLPCVGESKSKLVASDRYLPFAHYVFPSQCVIGALFRNLPIS
ncbi:MAG: hypothetical protein R3C14_34295 [Caldilineaceae bacterium]